MDYEKITQAAQNVDNFIKDNAAVKTILIDTSAAMFGDTSKEAKQSIQELLDAPLGDKKEIAMKKAYAAALVVAKDRNLLPHLPNTGAAMAALVDDGLERVKAGYLVGQGLMFAEEAIDNIVDHTAARAVAFVDTAFSSGAVSHFATESIVKLTYMIPEIGPVIGPIAENFKPIIKSVIQSVEEPVKNAIKTGINKVATVAKSIARKAIEKVKEAGKVFAKKLSEIFA